MTEPAQEPVEEVVEPVEEVVEPSARELELQAENDALRAQAAQPAPAPAPANVVPTSNDLRNLSDEQWGPIEEKYGKERGDIIAAVERQELITQNNSTTARLNVAEALEEAIESDPTVSKLKVGIREYMSGVPLADKADPAKIKMHMDRAKVFAKGRLAEKRGNVAPILPGKGGGKQVPTPTPGGDDAPIIEREGEVKPGDEFMLGNTKVRVSDRASEELRKATKHPTDPNGVMFGSKFHEKPVFRRG